MLQFNKKVDKIAHGPDNAHGAWHPDFRINQDLPDIKTVRTKFFLNVAAISFFAFICLLVIVKEVEFRNLKTDLNATNAKISETQKPNDDALKLHKGFKVEEDKFRQAHALVKDNFYVSDFLIHIGETLPYGIKIVRVEFRGLNQPLNLAVVVSGTDTVSGDLSSRYVQALKDDDFLAKKFAAVNLLNLTRNQDLGNISMSLGLQFVPNVKTSSKTK